MFRIKKKRKKANVRKDLKANFPEGWISEFFFRVNCPMPALSHLSLILHKRFHQLGHVLSDSGYNDTAAVH